jgi:hypothetical protein
MGKQCTLAPANHAITVLAVLSRRKEHLLRAKLRQKVGVVSGLVVEEVVEATENIVVSACGLLSVFVKIIPDHIFTCNLVNFILIICEQKCAQISIEPFTIVMPLI